MYVKYFSAQVMRLRKKSFFFCRWAMMKNIRQHRDSYAIKLMQRSQYVLPSLVEVSRSLNCV